MKNNSYRKQKQTLPTLTGTIQITRDGYGFVAPDVEHQDVFIPARFKNFSLQGDRVLISVQTNPKDSRSSGRVLEVLERKSTHCVGQLLCPSGQLIVRPEGWEFDILISSDGGIRDVGKLVSVKITEYPTPGKPMRGKIDRVLGDPLEESSLIQGILIEHGISRTFPLDVLKEAEDLPRLPKGTKRVDLRHHPICTIDGMDAKDFDDAVFVEKNGSGYRLIVCIADVPAYIKRGGALDEEALRRGTSVYLPDFAIPMLPEILSNDLCSLKPGEDRLTLTCEIHYDREGNGQRATFYESIIQSQKRATYDEIQAFFDGDRAEEEDLNPEIKKSLAAMKELALLLLAQRKKRGSLDFDLPEAKIIYDHTGRIETIQKAKRFFSHQLIEEFMIAANRAVAELFSRAKLPLLYRVHEKPDANKILDFFRFIRNLGIHAPKLPWKNQQYAQFLDSVLEHPMEAVLHQLLLRSLPQAVYSPDNKGHFGLNLQYYGHFTSPIRRYPDLTVHRQLKALCKGAPNHRVEFDFKKKSGPIKMKLDYSTDNLKKIGQSSSAREREAMLTEREVMDLKQALFLQDHRQEKFFGSVKRVTKSGVFVELEPHFARGLLSLDELKDDHYEFDEAHMALIGRRQKKKIRVGDRMWVRVKEVRLKNRMTDLELAE